MYSIVNANRLHISILFTCTAQLLAATLKALHAKNR